MTLITDVRLRRVLDSRGNPTVEADGTGNFSEIGANAAVATSMAAAKAGADSEAVAGPSRGSPWPCSF